MDKAVELKTVLKNETFIHPVTLKLIEADDKNEKCITLPYYEDGKIKYYKDGKCKKENEKEYQMYMETPPVPIDVNILVSYYNVDTIEELEVWIYENMITYPIKTINRVINCWIISNYNMVKNLNDIFERFIFDIIRNYYNLEVNKKELKSYVDKWFEKKNINDYDVDLLKDYIKFINKNHDYKISTVL